ncbi:oxygen-insensitive NADPH nitroreductase [Brevibacillus brevis]|uniref:oxygen-insensitive NADPH nitroreductase n=1 Tax=Brevibacillus brevis TaxID=1393 RepID=UPI0011593791|nr:MULTISPECIES: oxygen-insensitive NADPH nitroreductase [Bacillales]TQR37284.1 oxygen-insensitive NADPH nitroreductase [Lysinibacillus sp. SDF0063]UIO40026.1 oxygen-insensitive NADPH nitroreductase [Brevibacillus brevis]
MNETIKTLLHHRSIRKFEDRPLTDQQIRTIIDCAQAASTSSYIQAYSIIGVKEKEKKRRLAELAGNQPYVETNGHLFIFCADLYRHELLAEMEGADITASLESAEKYMVAVIDAALAAQNAAIASESMGLGICYIGGLRNNVEEVAQVVSIPRRVIPLFAMTVGYPLHESSKKPRLPFEHVYHEEGYNEDKKELQAQLLEYNKTIQEYYLQRTSGERSDTWTGQMAAMLSKPTRMFMKEFVEKQGFHRR